MNLKLHNRDEVFLVKLDSALYFKAEDHYTCVYYGRDTKQLLPFGLAHIEDALTHWSCVMPIICVLVAVTLSICKRLCMSVPPRRWLRSLPPTTPSSKYTLPVPPLGR